MIKHTNKMWSCLFVIAIFSFVSGCGSDSSIGNNGAPAVITVTNYSGARISGATVVLGDNNGSMKTYGKTDADGQITFNNAPADATVTAANACLQSGSTTTNYAIDVKFYINGSAVLSLDDCAAPSTLPPSSDSPLGTLTVNVTNTPTYVTQNLITIGRQVFVGFVSPITTQTVTIREYDLDSNGAVSVIVTGRDVSNNPVAYGILLDQTFTDGMTVDIPMAPMSFVQYQISNIPATAVTLQPSINIYSSGRSFSSDHYPSSLLSSPSSTTIGMAYIPGFSGGITYRMDVELDQDHDGVADSIQSLYLESSAGTPTNQSFDLSKALRAPYVTVTGADTATPALSWSGVDPAATSIFIGAILRSSTTSWYLSLNNLKRSRTSIRYPELPDSLAVFRPNQVEYFSVSTSAFEGSVSKSSSGSYQAPNP